MKRILELSLAVFLCLGCGWAQDTTQKQMTKPTPPPAAHDRMAMHQQMMKNMQANLDSMKANLQKMKDQLRAIEDPGIREQAQLNITMWQSLIDNMDKTMQMMKSMMGGPGMGHDHDAAGPPHDHEHEHEHEHEHMHGASPTPTPKQ